MGRRCRGRRPGRARSGPRAGVLRTQSDTAQAITGRHTGYVMTVKANMPTLYKQLKKLPWTAIPGGPGR